LLLTLSFSLIYASSNPFPHHAPFYFSLSPSLSTLEYFISSLVPLIPIFFLLISPITITIIAIIVTHQQYPSYFVPIVYSATLYSSFAGSTITHIYLCLSCPFANFDILYRPSNSITTL
jgi:hypothetical protein